MVQLFFISSFECGVSLRRNAVGLGDAVKQLSKKPKMSVLEKTQHDWTTFKAESGIHVSSLIIFFSFVRLCRCFL